MVSKSTVLQVEGCRKRLWVTLAGGLEFRHDGANPLRIASADVTATCRGRESISKSANDGANPLRGVAVAAELAGTPHGYHSTRP